MLKKIVVITFCCAFLGVGVVNAACNCLLDGLISSEDMGLLGYEVYEEDHYIYFIDEEGTSTLVAPDNKTTLCSYYVLCLYLTYYAMNETFFLPCVFGWGVACEY